MTDLTGAVWRKSTRSGDNGGDCVEVADQPRPASSPYATRRTQRDPLLTFTAQAWTDFIAAAKREGRAS